MRHLIIALAAFVLPTAALAQTQGGEATTIAAPAAQTPAAQTTLMPGALDLPIVEGSSVPTDCQFPAGLRAAGHYELGCVIMPRNAMGDHIGAQYLGMLGQRGWHQGDMITGGFSAVHTEANGCEKVMGIYPSAYPPGDDEAAAPAQDPEEFGGEGEDDDSAASGDTVIWFALDRQERCHTQAQ